MSLRELIAKLDEAPSQHEPAFPFEIRRIVGEFRAEAIEACEQILDQSDGEIGEMGGTEPQRIRFLALYVLLLVNWREFNYPRYRELVDRYAGDFDDQEYPYFLTFWSQYYFSRGDDVEDIEQALDYALMAVERLPEGPAVLHLMASTTAKVVEAGGSIDSKGLEKAEQAINAAIRLDRRLVARGEKDDRFARYHATKARLLTLRGRNRDARAQLHKAMELEDPGNVSRIAEYLEVRGQISLNETVGPVRQDLEDLAEKIEEEGESLRGLSAEVADQIRLQAVQLLGLLAAVLAFLFTGAEIARSLEFQDATKLMTVISGSLLIVFGGFSLIFYADQMSTRRVAAVLAAAGLGGALIATGLLV